MEELDATLAAHLHDREPGVGEMLYAAA